MISVLLVDDEVLVKVGLKSLVNWEDHGYSIVAEGENGEQGVELYKRYRPDLVITDIMMHPMNGIEMMREIKKFDPSAKFIVLSGYDEFDMVKQALKLGAIDYQLKLNTSAESLANLLDSARVEFQGTQEVPQTEKAENLDSQSRTVLQRDFLKNLIGNVFPDRDYIDAKKKSLGLSLDERRLYLSVIHTDFHRIVERYASKDFKLFEFMVLEILKEIGGEFYEGYVLPWSLGVFVMIFSTPSSETEEESAKKISDMSSVFQDMLREYFGFDFQVSSNGPCKGLESLHTVFEKTWVDSTVEPEQTGLELSGKSSEDSALSMETADPSLRETLTRAFDMLDIPVVESSFSKIFQHIESCQSTQINTLSTYCMQIVGFCDISLGVGFRNFCMENGVDINDLVSLNTKNDLLSWMNVYKDRVLEHLNILSAHKNILIENAKDYVLKNFSKRIVLNDVADYLKISPGYLSSLFTKYEGIHFIDYVNQVKINEAKKMLRTGNYKIYQVAYMLGYENSSYFSRIFKKVTGCAPKDLLY